MPDDSPNPLEAIAEAVADLLQQRATEPAQPAPTPAPTPRPPPAFDAGAPSTAPGSYRDSDDPLTWSRDHINRILADKGTREGRKYIRRRLEQAMENVRIVLPR